MPERFKKEIIDLGFVDAQDKYDAYAAAELLCQPSKHESFSLVIMESWLNERPVIVSAECEVTKNFAVETNGGLYFSNYAEFEGSVNYIFDHPDVARQMGLNGKKYVLEHFSWNVIVRAYTEYFEKLAERSN